MSVWWKIIMHVGHVWRLVTSQYSVIAGESTLNLGAKWVIIYCCMKAHHAENESGGCLLQLMNVEVNDGAKATV